MSQTALRSVKNKKATRQRLSTRSQPKRRRTRSAPKSRISALWFVAIGLVIGGIAYFDMLPLTDVSNEYLRSRKIFLLFYQKLAYPFLFAAAVYFAYQVTKKQFIANRLDQIVVVLSFIVAAVLYTFVLHEHLTLNGDNASYIIGAQSLIERGGLYQLHLPGQPHNRLGSIGLPLLLAPVYHFWGMDVFKMKLVVWILMLFSFPLLFLLFRKLVAYPLAALLTIVCFTHATLFTASTVLMTEGPFIFFMILSALLIVYYREKEYVNWFLLIASLICMGMLYFTRVIGLAAFPAAAIYLLIQIPVKGKNLSQLWQDNNFKKFLAFSGPLILFLSIYLVIGLNNNGHPLSSIISMDLKAHFSNSAANAWLVLSTMFSPDYLIRWVNVNGIANPTLSLLSIAIDIVVIIGLLRSLWKKEYIALFTIYALLALLIGNPVANETAPMVMARYLSVLVPFLIYFLYHGVVSCGQLATGFVHAGWAKDLGKMAGLIGLLWVLPSHFSAMGFWIAKNNAEHFYTEAEACFFEAAEWSKNNLSQDAIVVSRKPRLFYVYSGLQGFSSTGGGDKYSDEVGMKKLRRWQSQGADYLVLGSFSTYSYRNVYPIVKNYPQFFSPALENSKNGNGDCYVLELRYDSLD